MERLHLKQKETHINYGKRIWKCIIPLMLICTGIYSLDGITQIIDKYWFFVVIEGRVGQVASFHNIICDLVYFKLNVVLWHFIIINFYIPRVKSVNEYSLLYFCVCMAGLFENWWDYTVPNLDVLNTRNHTLWLLSSRPWRIHCASGCICALDYLVDIAPVQFTLTVINSSILCQIKSLD